MHKFRLNNLRRSHVEMVEKVCKVALIISFIWLVIISALYATQTYAQTAEVERVEVRDIGEKKYTALLTALFDRVGEEIPEGAAAYTKDVDEYRARVFKSIRDNERLIKTLRTLMQELPEELREEYRQEVAKIKVVTDKQTRKISEYTESSALLVNSVTKEYDLHSSIIDRIFHQIGEGVSVDNLNKLRVSAYMLRKEIALLYIKIKSNIGEEN